MGKDLASFACGQAKQFNHWSTLVGWLARLSLFHNVYAISVLFFLESKPKLGPYSPASSLCLGSFVGMYNSDHEHPIKVLINSNFPAIIGPKVMGLWPMFQFFTSCLQIIFQDVVIRNPIAHLSRMFEMRQGNGCLAPGMAPAQSAPSLCNNHQKPPETFRAFQNQAVFAAWFQFVLFNTLSALFLMCQTWFSGFVSKVPPKSNALSWHFCPFVGKEQLHLCLCFLFNSTAFSRS